MLQIVSCKVDKDDATWSFFFFSFVKRETSGAAPWLPSPAPLTPAVMRVLVPLCPALNLFHTTTFLLWRYTFMYKTLKDNLREVTRFLRVNVLSLAF